MVPVRSWMRMIPSAWRTVARERGDSECARTHAPRRPPMEMESDPNADSDASPANEGARACADPRLTGA